MSDRGDEEAWQASENADDPANTGKAMLVSDSVRRELAAGQHDQKEDESDSDGDGGAELLLRLGVALARGNRNDDAAVALRKAMSLAEDETMVFEAEENFLVVVNRLFQPIDAFMMFRNYDLVLAFEEAMKSIAPRTVLDIGSGSCAGVVSMLAAKNGAKRVIIYESLKVRAEVVEEVVKANKLQKQVRVIKQDFLLQPEATAPQRANPADTLVLDVSGSFGHDLFNCDLVPALLHAKAGQFLSADVRVVPSSVHLVFVVVESVGIQELEEVRQPIDGYNLSAFNKFSRNTRTIQLSSIPHRQLCKPVRCATVDLQAVARGDSERGGIANRFLHNVDVTQSGHAHGLVYWYEVETEPGRSVSLGPEAGLAGREMVWILGQGGAPPQLEARAGATVEIEVSAEGTLHLALIPAGAQGARAGAEKEKVGEEEEEDGEDPFTQCKGIPLYHFSMINDLSRAAAYSAAVAAALTDLGHLEKRRVLDVGCGSGLLSLMAVGHGAEEVHGCDKAPGMAAVARKVVEDNEMSLKIRIHDKLSTSLTVGDDGQACDMPGKADLLISETFGDDPFSESFLPSLAHARQHLLHPHVSLLLIAQVLLGETDRARMDEQARVVPEALVVLAVALESQELLELNSVLGRGPLAERFGLDLSAWACFSRRRWSCRLPDHSVKQLTPVFEAFTVDWSPETESDGDGDGDGSTANSSLLRGSGCQDQSAEVPLVGGREVEVEVVQRGTVHAIAAWYTLELHRGAQVRLSTDPASDAMQGRHWRQAVFFLPDAQRREVQPGDTLSLSASFKRDRLSFRLL